MLHSRGPNNRSAEDGGFTLVELVMVIVVLGILAGIVVVALSSIGGTSAQAACKADYKTVEVAVEAFKAQEGVYPTAGKNGISGSDAVAGLMQGDTTVTPSLGPWLRDAPTNGRHYRIEAATDGSGSIQVYTWDGTTRIPSGVAPTPSPTHTVADCAYVS